VLVLHSATTMRLNYQPMLHVRNVRQSARIIRMDREVLRTGCKASIEFEFMYRPEWLRVGSRLLFREGKTKGIGNVSALLADAPTSAVERAVGAAAAPRLAAPLRA
jgi:GTPase